MPPTALDSSISTGSRIFFRLLIFVAILFLVTLAVIKVPYEILVPELFPGAVEQGLMSSTISWGSTLLLAASLSALSALLKLVSFTGPAEESHRIISVKLDAIIKHLNIDLPAVIDAELAALVNRGRKIDAIALYRSYAEVSLAEAKAYVESLAPRGG
jgi:hypothetical protein